MYKTRTTCRLCEQPLKPVLNLGEIYVSTFVDTNETTAPKVPLSLTQCTSCGLIQLEHTVDGSVMYSDYWYKSGLNASMVKALQDIVASVSNYTTLNPGDVVVDIGANDGTLISNYMPELFTIAFEPSNLSQHLDGIVDVAFTTYFDAELYKSVMLRKAKVITAIAMFYDLEDPHTFVQGLKDILDEDGLIIIQMMDLLSMIKTGDFPNVCHEHLEYYSLAVFNKLMLDHGLVLVDVEYNAVNGGSLRAYIKHAETNTTGERVVTALVEEQSYFDLIGDISVYFNEYAQSVKASVTDFIKYLNSHDIPVAVMGASTKGNTLLQFFELDHTHIVHAAEVNEHKFGKYTIGTNIPIISDIQSLEPSPPYYLLLPWGFLPNFISKYKEYLIKGGAFIVPLPKPRVIYVHNGEIIEWPI